MPDDFDGKAADSPLPATCSQTGLLAEPERLFTICLRFVKLNPLLAFVLPAAALVLTVRRLRGVRGPGAAAPPLA